jgi:hypothetical protein
LSFLDRIVCSSSFLCRITTHPSHDKDPECDTVLEAIDAAIVRTLAEGADAIAARANPPFDFISVHTCQTNVVSRFPFPTPQSGDRLANAAARGYLRIAALGPYVGTPHVRLSCGTLLGVGLCDSSSTARIC